MSQERGADPGAVAFDAVTSAIARGADVLIVDTAGRLHTKTPPMDELGKVKRVIEKAGAQVDETLLVLDAQTGQNGIAQVGAFTDAVEVTGVVLTKTDGSAKGGIVLAVREELGVPVRFVGVGEGADDLRPFDARVRRASAVRLTSHRRAEGVDRCPHPHRGGPPHDARGDAPRARGRGFLDRGGADGHARSRWCAPTLRSRCSWT